MFGKAKCKLCGHLKDNDVIKLNMSKVMATVNNILDDISKKYKIDTSKERLREDVHVQEVKFKYRKYAECTRILYKNVGLMQEV
jgi:hypothetical protein